MLSEVYKVCEVFPRFLVVANSLITDADEQFGLHICSFCHIHVISLIMAVQRKHLRTDVPIGDDALCDLTDEDEEQDEGEQPAQVVTREVEPGAVMDVHL